MKKILIEIEIPEDFQQGFQDGYALDMPDATRLMLYKTNGSRDMEDWSLLNEKDTVWLPDYKMHVVEDFIDVETLLNEPETVRIAFATSHWDAKYYDDCQTVAEAIKIMNQRESLNKTTSLQVYDFLSYKQALAFMEGVTVGVTSKMVKEPVFIEERTPIEEATKRYDIEQVLLQKIWDMRMDKPENFEEILDFVYDDVCETADPINWSDGDVVIAFRRWIESQTKN